MDITYGCKFDRSGARFLFDFSLSKHGSVFRRKQSCEFELSEAYLKSLFTGVDDPDLAVMVEEDIPHFNDYIEYECDAPKYILAMKKKEVEELSILWSTNYVIRNAAEIIVRVNKRGSKCFSSKLLTFLPVSNTNTKDYETKLLSFSKLKNI